LIGKRCGWTDLSCCKAETVNWQACSVALSDPSRGAAAAPAQTASEVEPHSDALSLGRILFRSPRRIEAGDDASGLIRSDRFDDEPLVVSDDTVDDHGSSIAQRQPNATGAISCQTCALPILW
jgi:hypothetical protein